MSAGSSGDTHLVCIKPFDWYEIGPNKDVYLCCPGWMPKSVGNALSLKPTAIWNSIEAADVRRSVVDGSFKYCSAEHCPHLLNQTFPVMRVTTQEKQMLERRVSIMSTPDNEPKHLNFSYDRSCNLACGSCRNELIMASRAERETFANLPYVTLSEFNSKKKELYITGSGDPFASRHFWEFLTSESLSNDERISLRLHTNGQLCTPDRWRRIAHLEHRISTLEISIDAASAVTYALNRSPGDWSLLNDNMAFLAKLRSQGRIHRLQLDFVVQNNNFSEMIDFIKLAKRWRADLIYFSALNNWGTYSTQDYLDRAVHRPNHRNHYRLVEVLKHPAMEDPLIYCGFTSLALSSTVSVRDDFESQLIATLEL